MIIILLSHFLISLYIYYTTFTQYIHLCDLVKDFYIKYITCFNYHLYENDIDDNIDILEDVDNLIIKKNSINSIQDILIIYITKIYNNDQEHIKQIELYIHKNINTIRFHNYIPQQSYSELIKSFTKISTHSNKINNLRLFMGYVDPIYISYIIFTSYIYIYITTSLYFAIAYLIVSQYMYHKCVYLSNTVNNLDQLFDKCRYIDTISETLKNIKYSYIYNIEYIEYVCDEYEKL